MFDVNELRAHYRRFDDDRIKRIAEYESKGLREEVVPILIEEIKKRELGKQLITWIKAERRQLSSQELKALKAKVKECICELCQQNRQLKGYRFRTLVGMIVGEVDYERILVVCEKCGKANRRNSAIRTSLFGWWSVRGLLTTPFILIDKLKAQIREEHQSDEIITTFIQENIGLITIGYDDKRVIQKLLKTFNEDEKVSNI
ncbi:MAG: hypothetical protein AAGI23_04895 [Bacteroidota bacterium]